MEWKGRGVERLEERERTKGEREMVGKEEKTRRDGEKNVKEKGREWCREEKGIGKENKEREGEEKMRKEKRGKGLEWMEGKKKERE